MPPYTRLRVDERRRRLLELGVDLFTRHDYDELSMSSIARAAGISKALLYHYFPSKQAFFAATLEDAARDLAQRVEPPPGLDPAAALEHSLAAFLDWVAEHRDAYLRVLRSGAAVPEVRELVEQVRARTVERILAGLRPDAPPPVARAAVRGWLWFLDGAILDWLEHRDVEPSELRPMLLRALRGATAAP